MAKKKKKADGKIMCRARLADCGNDEYRTSYKTVKTESATECAHAVMEQMCDAFLGEARDTAGPRFIYDVACRMLKSLNFDKKKLSADLKRELGDIDGNWVFVDKSTEDERG
jgi:hypothetical protein